jgi:hypothetical protein
MYNNVYFVTFFVLDESKLESHKQLSYNYDIMSTDAALAPDGAAGQLASLLKTLGSNNDLKKNKGTINTVDQWYEGATLLGEYASETSPPVLPAVSIIRYNKYCTWFRRLLRTHHADSSKAVLTAGLRFDEQFRIHLARTFSPEDMDWDATAFGPYEDFKNQLEKLQYSVVKNLESMVTGLKTQMENFKKSGKQQQKQPGNGGNGGKSKQSDKKSTSIKDKILKLCSPGGKKAQAKCLEKDGKEVCYKFNTAGGCQHKNCTFSHHCVATGRANKSILEADDASA